MSDREKLATYQAKLLDALHAAAKRSKKPTPHCEVLAADAGMADDLGPIDPRMLRIAMQLTHKWGIPKNKPNSGN